MEINKPNKKCAVCNKTIWKHDGKAYHPVTGELLPICEECLWQFARFATAVDRGFREVFTTDNGKTLHIRWAAKWKKDKKKKHKKG